MQFDRKTKAWTIGVLIALVCLGFVFGWFWRARLASDPSSAAGIGSCFLVYRIGAEELRIQTPDGYSRIFSEVKSGDGRFESISKRGRGPLPPGVYVVLTRDDGAATYDDHPAFLLDPIDGQPGNDRVDGAPREQGGGRSAFRIHGGMATQGCLASWEIDGIAELLLPHASQERFDVYSFPADSGREGMKRFRETVPDSGEFVAAPEDGDWELFEQERRIGVLWVLP
jgi:hypothetical protein